MAPERKKTPDPDEADKRIKQDETKTPGENNKPKANLFSLPAELRNYIYELAMVTSDQNARIWIRPGYKIPGLLSSCQQARAEAYKIYWLQNKFMLEIWDCDDTLSMKIEKLLDDHLGDDDSSKVDLTLYCRGRKKWMNLLAWCRHIHAGESTSSLKPDFYFDVDFDRESLEDVISSAHEIAEKYCDKSGETCLVELKEFKEDNSLSSFGWFEYY